MITECEKQLSDHRIISAPESTCSYYVQKKLTMPGFQRHRKLAVLPISHREICERYRAKKMPMIQTHTLNPSQLNYSEFGLHYELLKEHEKEELKTEARN